MSIINSDTLSSTPLGNIYLNRYGSRKGAFSLLQESETRRGLESSGRRTRHDAHDDSSFRNVMRYRACPITRRMEIAG